MTIGRMLLLTVPWTVVCAQDVFLGKDYASRPVKRYQTADEYSRDVVKYLLAFPSPLQDGNVQLHRLGDRAAGYILEILKTRNPLTDAEMRTALDIVHKAYEKPRSIMGEANRKSTTATVTSLQDIGAATQDPAIRSRALDEQIFVMTIAAAALPLRTPSSGGIGTPPAPGTTPFR